MDVKTLEMKIIVYGSLSHEAGMLANNPRAANRRSQLLEEAAEARKEILSMIQEGVTENGKR